jgi:hypothetical protein
VYSRIAAQDILQEATWAALVKVERIMDEPTGLGGDYVTFEVVRVLRGPSAKTVGLGAHGWRSGLSVGEFLLVSLAPDLELPLQRSVVEAFSRHFIDMKIDAAVTAMIRVESIEKGAALYNELEPKAKP